MSVQVFPDADALNRKAAEEISGRARAAVERHGRCSVVLSGGSTPRSVYALLASEYQDQMPWSACHFFWGDERCVPPVNPDSNYRMATEAMLSHVPVPAENIHRIRAEAPDPRRAAEQYGAEIRAFFAGEPPRFDIVLLGLGPDGHTASLFPGTAALQETTQTVVANWVEKLNTWRITMTAPLLNQAACVMFLVEGAVKADALRSVLHGAREPEKFPAQLIHPESGELLWLLDAEAARLL